MSRTASREQRRTAVRIPVNKVPAELKLREGRNMRRIQASLLDVSSSGALLELHEVGLMMGTELQLSFHLPGGEHFDLDCVVVRSLNLDDCSSLLAPGASCRLAVLFRFDTESRRDKLVRWSFATQAQARRHLRASQEDDDGG